MCNLNVIVVLDFISRDLYLLFAILFSSKFQNSIFYQYMRPKSGLKFPRPFTVEKNLCILHGQVFVMMYSPVCSGPVHSFMNQLVNQSVNQSLNQSLIQSIKQSIN